MPLSSSRRASPTYGNLFVHVLDRETFGFTADPGGANLPDRTSAMGRSRNVTNPTWLATDVTDAIKRDGFYVMSKTDQDKRNE